MTKKSLALSVLRFGPDEIAARLATKLSVHPALSYVRQAELTHAFYQLTGSKYAALIRLEIHLDYLALQLKA